MIPTKTISKTIINHKVLKGFWEIKEKDINNRSKDNVIQMGFGDTTVKKLILEYITNAKEHIFLASFILSDDEIVKALQNSTSRGVRFYVLTSNEALLEKERRTDNSEFTESVVNHHKSIIKKLEKSGLVRGSPFLHAKFVLVDVFSNPRGVMLTSNITTEALTRNPELAMILQKDQVSELFNIYRYVFWSQADQELANQKWGKFEKRNVPLKYSTKIITTIKGKNTLERDLINLLKRSNGKVYVGSYKLTKSTDFFKALLDYGESNEVVLFTRLHPANQEVYDILTGKPNFSLYAAKYFHAKFVVTNIEGLIMTANLNEQSFDDGFEVAVKIGSTKAFSDIADEWIKSLEYEFIHQKEVSKINSKHVKIYDKQKSSFNQLEITEKNFYENKVTESIEEYLQMDENSIRIPTLNYQKSITVTYNVEPPKLPKDATEIKKKSDLKNPKILKEFEELLFDKKDRSIVPLYFYKNKLYSPVKDIKAYEKTKKNTTNITSEMFSVVSERI